MPRRLISFCFLIAIFGLFSASRAKADDVFTWTLPASPTIASTDFQPGVGFMTMDVPLSENGASLGNFVFAFFNTSDGGGFDAFSGSSTILNEFGPQVYKGGESAPTFMTGTFGPFDGQGSLTTGMTGTLHITGAGNGNDLFTYSVTTPEPSSLLLLGTGALGLLSFARKRVIAQRV